MIIDREAMLTGATPDPMRLTSDAPLREVSDVLVRHLHAFIREARSSEQEIEQGIAFIAGLGQAAIASADARNGDAVRDGTDLVVRREPEQACLVDRLRPGDVRERPVNWRDGQRLVDLFSLGRRLLEVHQAGLKVGMAEEVGDFLNRGTGLGQALGRRLAVVSRGASRAGDRLGRITDLNDNGGEILRDRL